MAILDDLERARWRFRRETTIALPSDHPHWPLAAAVEERDARELRGEPIDWTRPIDGWRLW